MIKKLLMTTITSSLFISGCSSNYSPPKDDVIEKNLITLKNGNKIELRYAYNQSVNKKDQVDMLHIVHPSHAVGTTSLIVFQTILKGIAGQGGIVPTFKKENLVGSKINVENINKTYTYPKYLQLLREKLVLDKKNDYSSVALSFYPGRFYLVYDDMIGNDNYTLYVSFLTDFESTVWYPSSKHDFVCLEKVSGITEKEWAKNNYALAIEEGYKLIDKCLFKLDKTYFDKLSEKIQLEYNIQEAKQNSQAQVKEKTK